MRQASIMYGKLSQRLCEVDVGYRETMVPIKTALIVVAAFIFWFVSIGELVVNGFSFQVLL